MKTINYLFIILTATLLFSCGKSNKVTSAANGAYSTYSGRNPVTDYGTPEQNAYINEARSHYTCKNGGTRLEDVTFSTTTIVSQTSISGSPMNNSVIAGTVANVYAGFSDYGDLMFVSKMTNGQSVIGYNVTVSFCPHNTLLTPGRAIVGFYASRITFTDSSTCGMPAILAASNTQAILDAYSYVDNGYTVNLPSGQVAMTSFLPVCY